MTTGSTQGYVRVDDADELERLIGAGTPLYLRETGSGDFRKISKEVSEGILYERRIIPKAGLIVYREEGR